MPSWLERAEQFGRFVETTLLVILITVLLLLAASQIVLRNAFSSGLAWADAVVRLSVLWLAVIGAVAAARDRRHIAIGIITRSLGGRLRQAVTVAVHGFTSAVALYFAWQSYRYVDDSRVFGDLFTATLPAWWVQIVLPVGFALIGYRYLIYAIAATRRGA